MICIAYPLIIQLLLASGVFFFEKEITEDKLQQKIKNSISCLAQNPHDKTMCAIGLQSGGVGTINPKNDVPNLLYTPAKAGHVKDLAWHPAIPALLAFIQNNTIVVINTNNGGIIFSERPHDYLLEKISWCSKNQSCIKVNAQNSNHQEKIIFFNISPQSKL